MLNKRIVICLGFLVFLGTFPLFSQNRYALVIGNSSYQNGEISQLSNPANDSADIAEVLKDLGFKVVLRTNVGLRQLINAVADFTKELKNNDQSEGFFWYAGHGLSVKNVHYLLPVDVDPTDDFSITRSAFSVDDLMTEIESAGNLTNLVVIDACRNNVIPGSRSVNSRGLAILSHSDMRIRGNKIVYSTQAGMTASDGTSGAKNSPFAQAFIANIGNPETFDDVFLDIADGTLKLTNGQQEPYSMGTFAVKSYSLNPDGVKVSLFPGAGGGSAGEVQKHPEDFSKDGTKFWDYSTEPKVFQHIRPWMIILAVVIVVVILGNILKFIFRRNYLNKLRQNNVEENENNITVCVNFGFSSRHISCPSLETAWINCKFGALEVFFDQTALSPNGAEIFLNCSLGAAELCIPKHWKVIDKTNCTLSGILNKNRNASLEENAPLLILSGSITLSVVEIKYI